MIHGERDFMGAVLVWNVAFLMWTLELVAPWKIAEIDDAPN